MLGFVFVGMIIITVCFWFQGFETARCLASHGCRVILACRDSIRGMNAVRAIQNKHVCQY